MRHFNELYEASTTQSPVAITLDQEETQAFFNEYFKLPEVPQGRKEATKAVQLIDIGGYYQINTGIFLMRYTEGIYSSYEKDIIQRFSKVFEQAYTRFLDLQKAEAQARESEIELGLERVRARAMAMSHSDELNQLIGTIFNEFTRLDMTLTRAALYLIEPETKSSRWWMANSEAPTKPMNYMIPYHEHAPYLAWLEAWGKKELTWKYNLKGKIKRDWDKFLFSNTELSLMPDFIIKGMRKPESVILTASFNNYGSISLATLEPLPENQLDILIRFSKVFEQTYTRFLDLQKAEARERDAIKQASVDRVRAEIASMRTTTDLERITPLIWNELTTLGVPFIRSGVFIMDEVHQQVQVHLSTPDGKAIAAFQLNYEATNQSRQIVSHWREKKIFKDHMDEVAFAEFTKNLVQQGAISSNEKYVTENRPTDLYLHFLPFLQGMLYVGNDAPLKQDELHLVQNLAEAFSTAYARYEDFKKLELAKSAVESAMIELKATQTQLIQQEKLASLGQLTAGIAHEIRNPLNFVNNFSEVSIEMIEEVQEERIKSPESRDEGLVDEILEDIKSNLQKVHEHGTRANTIVSSMLQHSRGGSGKMEPTDLNALIKEYVNLSFHGMRAGKNPINVDIQLHLDETLGKVNLIGEDFSRVVLNLVNNAFDAMREKTKTEPDYKPVLSIYTRSIDKVVEISIGDNGPGIPDEIKDKILQPFFTTKKGTEGTGLGLSITHDIVKAHGGELEIDTSMNKGTNFKIKLHT
jgi:signal transduction histidine kinase